MPPIASKLAARFYAIALVVILLARISAQAATDKTDGQEQIDLRIYYAGNPESERSQDFAALLELHFAKVHAGDYEKFTPDDAKDYDVIVFDWTSIYPRDENGKIHWNEELQMEQPKPPTLDRSFSRPCVLIGAAGGSICNQLQIAINWKCLCMENVAHDVQTEHAIFQGPLPVEISFEEREKPLDYYTHPGTDKLGEKIKVWKVQEKTFPEIDPGLVSSRENFTHTPDAEIISGGINGKGPTSVAIGRHGNFFLWGFSGQPSEMTEAGRNAFINAICYIAKFDGQAPSAVQPSHGGREFLLEQVYSLRSLSDEYLQKQVEKFEEMIRDNPPPEEQLKEIGDDPAAYFRKMFEPYAKQVREKLPAEVRAACDDDTEKLISYYRDNLEYLRSDGTGGFVVDEDARALGISNRSRDLLKRCVELLERGEDSERAKRLLEQYTGQSHEEPSDWRKWLDENVDQLHFDESTGVFSR